MYMPSSGGVTVDTDSDAVTIDSDDDGEIIESAITGAPNIEARIALPT
jgi:hypothetical protein